MKIKEFFKKFKIRFGKTTIILLAVIKLALAMIGACAPGNLINRIAPGYVRVLPL